MMLQDSKAFSSYSVNDLQKARHFYSEVLGLVVKDNDMGMLELNTGGGHWVLLYPKSNHVPATFTVLNFLVQDISKAVEGLIGKGIVFEQYSGDIQTDVKGIAWSKGRGPHVAWFRDPDGNILSVVEE